MNVNPIGILLQPPSSNEPDARATAVTPLLTKVVALPGTVDGAKGIHAAVKLPALKPELIVADVPGHTPFAVVVTVAEGRG